MNNYSIWKKGIKNESYSKLNKDIEVEVLIIGGGITGVSTLYYLKDSNLKVALVERNRIGYGITGNSTGKLNYLQDNLCNKIRKNFDDDVASKYLNSQKYAVDLVVNVIKKEKIDCDLVKVPSYIYTNDDSEIKNLKDYQNFLEVNNINTFVLKSDLVESKYLFGVNDTYIFNPISFVSRLASKCYKNNIFEDTSIVKIDYDEGKYICYTNDNFMIRSKWIVISSHYPYFNLPFMFPIKGYLDKSYLSASKYNGSDVSLISYDKPVISIRTYKDYLLYLSNSHEVGNLVDDKKNFGELMKKVSDLDLKPEYLWSNMDIMTNDGLPYVGEISNKMLLGTGYNTWGLANGVLAGKIISDIILMKDNEYIELFNPKRKNISMITGAVNDGIVSVLGYINGLINNSSKIEYENIDGKDIAIYRDENGKHQVYTKCPHMGCKLLFNEIEKTWDCPCHASRFDIDGKCISGPSNIDINVK